MQFSTNLQPIGENLEWPLCLLSHLFLSRLWLLIGVKFLPVVLHVVCLFLLVSLGFFFRTRLGFRLQLHVLVLAFMVIIVNLHQHFLLEAWAFSDMRAIVFSLVCLFSILLTHRLAIFLQCLVSTR